MEALQEMSSSIDDPIAANPSQPDSFGKLQKPPLTAAIPQRKSWSAIEWLPIQLSVSLPIPRFRVRDLLALDSGQTIATEWPNGDDLPLSIEDVQLAWVEMETADQAMAVRITRLL